MNLIKSELHKGNIPEAVAAITAAVDNGDVNPLSALALLKVYETIVTTARKEIMEQALKERAKYGKGECSVLGFKITEMESGVTYDYTGCCDPQWDADNKNIEYIKIGMKERETFLKALKEPITVVDEMTGEAVKIFP